jgi:urea transporter
VEQRELAQRSQTYGAIICAGSALTALVFLIGVLRRSYWALALPVMVGSLGALYVAFWIGRALITTPVEPPAED